MDVGVGSPVSVRGCHVSHYVSGMSVLGYIALDGGVRTDVGSVVVDVVHFYVSL